MCDSDRECARAPRSGFKKRAYGLRSLAFSTCLCCIWSERWKIEGALALHDEQSAPSIDCVFDMHSVWCRYLLNGYSSTRGVSVYCCVFVFFLLFNPFKGKWFLHPHETQQFSYSYANNWAKALLLSRWYPAAAGRELVDGFGFKGRPRLSKI